MGHPHGDGRKTSGGCRGTAAAEERPKPPSYQEFLHNHRKSGSTWDESVLELTQTKDSFESEIGAATTGATAGTQTVRSTSRKKNESGLSAAGINERMLSENK